MQVFFFILTYDDMTHLNFHSNEIFDTFFFIIKFEKLQ
jgi:hypothetical protein